MKAATAIKTFLSKDTENVSMVEIKEFKSVCTDEEWQEFGRQSCKALGVEFEPAS
uniref:Uncharacterized protein n=1 Tax=viral metagenome TaxID=1070528 RepID=A0A6M3LTR2_9ZZZZ